jgi:hypothetical protein
VRTVLALLLLGAAVAPGLAAQAKPKPAPASARRGCTFAVDYVGNTGSQQVIAGDTNYYAGGGVRLSCTGTSIRMSSDSLISMGRSGTIYFIGNVQYRDSVIIMNADRGTYFRSGDRWEARGNVVTENLQNGSTLTGPYLDYFRALPGVRDTAELYSIGRPTIKSVTTDSAGQRAEPYVIVGDRVRIKGNDRTWAGGKVTIDRSDFAARGDSLFLDSGAGNFGVLVGKPELQGLGKDSFNLKGRRIELTLAKREVTYVKALGQGHAVSAQIDLVADTIGLDLDNRVLIQTLAWGDSIKPRALASDYEIRGDSVAFDTPGRLLQQIRSYHKAWVGGKADSVVRVRVDSTQQGKAPKIDSLPRERDWMSGDTVVASFAQWDSAGTQRTRLERLEASGSARSYYRVAESKVAGGLPSINYSRGERIAVTMKPAGQRGVDRVDIRGQVDGVYLEPLPVVAPDTTKPTNTRRRGT